MPCYVTGSAEGDANLALDEAQQAATQATEMLCAVMRNLDNLGLEQSAPGNVQDWWKKHKRLDAQREARLAREKDKAKSVRLKRIKTELAGLTPEERKAIGLS